MARTLVNGHSETGIAPDDRGFTLGDGLFETIAVVGGEIRLWSAHMQRLEQGCRHLLIPPPDNDQLYREAVQVIAGDSHGSLRITVSRGPGARGYTLPASPVPTRVVSFHPSAPPATEPAPIAVVICTTRLGRQPALAGIKHLNRLEQILARAEVDAAGGDEGVMLDTAGHVVEATMCNLFLVHDGRLGTPDLTQCGVRGIMRSEVMQMAERLEIPCATREYGLADLQSAGEIFLTNSIRGIQPVHRAGERELNAPGPLTRVLAEALRESG